MGSIDDIVALCDALEWLLVPWGHKHTGKVVRSTYDRPAGGLVWSNKQPEFLPGHEAELRLVTWPDGRVAYTTGGDMSWVLDAAATRQSGCACASRSTASRCKRSGRSACS